MQILQYFEKLKKKKSASILIVFPFPPPFHYKLFESDFNWTQVDCRGRSVKSCVQVPKKSRLSRCKVLSRQEPSKTSNLKSDKWALTCKARVLVSAAFLTSLLDYFLFLSFFAVGTLSSSFVRFVQQRRQLRASFVWSHSIGPAGREEETEANEQRMNWMKKMFVFQLKWLFAQAISPAPKCSTKSICWTWIEPINWLVSHVVRFFFLLLLLLLLLLCFGCWWRPKKVRHEKQNKWVTLFFFKLVTFNLDGQFHDDHRLPANFFFFFFVRHRVHRKWTDKMTAQLWESSRLIICFGLKFDSVQINLHVLVMRSLLLDRPN